MKGPLLMLTPEQIDILFLKDQHAPAGSSYS